MADLFHRDIDLIEKHIYTLTSSMKDPIIRNETLRLIKSGGKRLRPLFLIWAAQSGTVTDECYKAASSLELLHTASLIHDDIVDQSPIRRGIESTFSLYGRESASSIGAVVSLFAIDTLSSIGCHRIYDRFTRTLRDLCIGELDQLDERYDFHTSLEDYYKKISKKTASLFALPCFIGGVLSGCSQEVVEKLEAIGYNIGCSFQIIDDIRDVTLSSTKSGKERGMDLKNGILTLPYLLKIKEDPEFCRIISSVGPGTSSEEFQMILSALEEEGYIHRSYEISNRYLDEAERILFTLPSLETRMGFQAVIRCLYHS